MYVNVNNETVGISAEVAIAGAFNVAIDSYYASRAEERIVQYIMPHIKQVFQNNSIPAPVKHIAQGQNPVDFELSNNKTLSVKTNQTNIGRAAPQNIGQPTSVTYFEYIKAELNYDVYNELRKRGLSDTYENRAKLFKEISINRIGEVINIYWRNMFDCDYLLFVYNVISASGTLMNQPCFKVFGKSAVPPKWDVSRFSFTQSIDSWNESCTLKYRGMAIGNFQVHSNRNCFKFRFNMDNIMNLINNNMI